MSLTAQEASLPSLSTVTSSLTLTQTSELNSVHTQSLNILMDHTKEQVLEAANEPEMKKAFDRLVHVVTNSKGGCLFILAPHGDPGIKELGIQATDGKYFYKRLQKTCSLSDRPSIYAEEFSTQIAEFTNQDGNDRWPNDYHDVEARGKAKDGLFLVSFNGTVQTAAAKIMKLKTHEYEWLGSGARHTAALHAASTIQRGAVIVRSQNGAIHVLTASSIKIGNAYSLVQVNDKAKDNLMDDPVLVEDDMDAQERESREDTPKNTDASFARAPSTDSIAETTRDPDSLSEIEDAFPPNTNQQRWQIYISNDHQCPKRLLNSASLAVDSLPQVEELVPHQRLLGWREIEGFIPKDNELTFVVDNATQKKVTLVNFISTRHLRFDLSPDAGEAAGSQVAPPKKSPRRSSQKDVHSVEPTQSTSSSSAMRIDSQVGVMPLKASGLHILDRGAQSWKWIKKDEIKMITEGDRVALALESPPDSGNHKFGDCQVADAICPLWIELRRSKLILPLVV